jgi:hypothetical protein
LPRWGEAEKIEDLFFREHRQKGLPSNLPTDPRAEIRIYANIAPLHISRICFPAEMETDMSSVIARHPLFRFSLDNRLFQPRCDFLHWQNIRKNGVDVYERK